MDWDEVFEISQYDFILRKINFSNQLNDSFDNIIILLIFRNEINKKFYFNKIIYFEKFCFFLLEILKNFAFLVPISLGPNRALNLAGGSLSDSPSSSDFTFFVAGSGYSSLGPDFLLPERLLKSINTN